MQWRDSWFVARPDAKARSKWGTQGKVILGQKSLVRWEPRNLNRWKQLIIFKVSFLLPPQKWNTWMHTGKPNIRTDSKSSTYCVWWGTDAHHSKKECFSKKDPCRTYNVPNLHEIPMYKKLRDIRPKSLYLKSHVAKILFSCYVVGFCLLPKHLLK